jgi:hypothetical protein
MKHIRLLVILLAGLLPSLLASCGSSFPYPIKPEDKASALRRPMIISMLNDDLAFRVNFDREKIPVPQWRLNEMLQDTLAARLRQQGCQPRTASVTLRQTARTQTWSQMTDSTSDLKFPGFLRSNPSLFGDADSVIFIEGHPGKHMFSVSGSVSNPPSAACNLFEGRVIYNGTARVTAYALTGTRMLSWGHGNDSGTEILTASWDFKHWKDAKPAMQAMMRDRLLRLSKTSLLEAAGRAGL